MRSTYKQFRNVESEIKGGAAGGAETMMISIMQKVGRYLHRVIIIEHYAHDNDYRRDGRLSIPLYKSARLRKMQNRIKVGVVIHVVPTVNLYICSYYSLGRIYYIMACPAPSW